jgi:hypothetical protein
MVDACCLFEGEKSRSRRRSDGVLCIQVAFSGRKNESMMDVLGQPFQPSGPGPLYAPLSGALVGRRS